MTTAAEIDELVDELRGDERLMLVMLAHGYRRAEFHGLILGWADRMRRAADTLETTPRPDAPPASTTLRRTDRLSSSSTDR